MNNWNCFIVFNLRDIDVKVEIKEINWSKTFFEIRRGRYVSLLSGNFTLRITRVITFSLGTKSLERQRDLSRLIQLKTSWSWHNNLT